MRLLRLRPPKWVYLLFLIGAASLTIRALRDAEFAHSALLYVSVPFAIAILLHHFVGYGDRQGAMGRYALHMRNATIVMLGSSAILFEGFLCVLMFMPIYYIVVTIVYVSITPVEQKGRGGPTFRAFVVPVVAIVLSLEGVTPATSFSRSNHVTVSAIVNADIDTLKANMAMPIGLEQRRHWFLSLFPQAERVEAGSLTPGDVHTLHFVYRRWLVTNVHRGQMRLRIESVGANHVRTRIIENTSYLANYLTIRGTKVRFEKLANGKTRVSLTVGYDRRLDPAWYFGPLQRLVVRLSAKYLISSVIAREAADG